MIPPLFTVIPADRSIKPCFPGKKENELGLKHDTTLLSSGPWALLVPTYHITVYVIEAISGNSHQEAEATPRELAKIRWSLF